jgi:hypothetical protein
MKKSIYLLGLLLLVACANDDEPTGQQVQNTYPLTIEVTENPLTPDGEEGSRTRTAITTTSSLTAFNLDYVYGGEYSTGSTSVTNDNGAWTGGSWPTGAGGEGMVNWYASTDGTFNANAGNPYINFSVVEDVSSQKDLLVATASGTYTGTSGKLTFNFNHACAALRFWIKESTNMSGYKLEIKEVVLCNVIKQAKYYYASGWAEWYSDRSVYTLYSSTSNYTLGFSDYIAMDGGTPNYLFMIPQALTAWDTSTAIAEATTQTYLKVKCTITKTSVNPNTVIYNDSYAYIPFGATLVAGKKYDVKINVGKNSLYSAANTKIITE